jgi:hypothetical protein
MHGPINVKSLNNTSKWQMEFNSAFKGLMRESQFDELCGLGQITVLWAIYYVESENVFDHLLSKYGMKFLIGHFNIKSWTDNILNQQLGTKYVRVVTIIGTRPKHANVKSKFFTHCDFDKCTWTSDRNKHNKFGYFVVDRIRRRWGDKCLSYNKEGIVSANK